MKDKTEIVHQWMKNQNDDVKQTFAINWKIPHSIFNNASRFYPGGYKALQNVDWYKIHKSRDLGNWSHGGKVYCL
jgi:hypothetical protein